MNRFVLGLDRPLEDPGPSRSSPAGSSRCLTKAPTGPDLRVLAVLQRDGRLVDFLQEDIDPYTDAQIGAAVRDIHRGCRKALRDYLTVEPILPGAEEDARSPSPPTSTRPRSA